MVIYVDDILISSPDEGEVLNVKRYLHELFTIKYKGAEKYFLGIEIARSEEALVLS